MKVCQVMAADTQGGLGKHLIDLCSGLSAHAEVVVVAHPNYAGKFPGAVRHVPLDMASGWRSPLLLWRLLRVLRRERADVVHAHGNRASQLVATLKPFLPALCVGTVHWHLRKPRNRAGYEKLDGVIGVSRAVLKDLKNPATAVVYNGVPTTPSPVARAELRQRYNLSADGRVAIAVGRMVRGKGFDLLLRAWKDQDGELLLVGEGPLRAELEALAGELGIQSRVRFAGFVPGAAELFPAADLVVVASRAEGFGYVLAEALVHRKPVVATDGVSGARELLPAEWLVPANDWQALARVLRQRLAALDDYDRALTEHYDWAAGHLSLEAMAANNIAFYEQLLQRPAKTKSA